MTARHAWQIMAIALCASLLSWTLPAPVGPVSAAHASESTGSALEALAWRRTLEWVRDAFPEVPTMTTRELASTPAADVLLLDARAPEEFNVSHIRGAVHAGDVRSALDAIAARPEQSTIVVYCSVGYRSSRLVEGLRKRGVANVYNLEGSLFRWANEGRPLYRGQERVQQVHPFDEEWGQLLHRRYWPD